VKKTANRKLQNTEKLQISTKTQGQSQGQGLI